MHRDLKITDFGETEEDETDEKSKFCFPDG
jgi:hypothetical protein